SALPCHPPASSRKDTPFPFLVRAMIAVGPPLWQARRASRMAAISWPSISIVRQPNAENLRASTPVSWWEGVQSLWPSPLTTIIATKFDRSLSEPNCAASQTEPSEHSPSPSKQKTRASIPSSRLATAIPFAAASPWPSDPVATLTHGLLGVGCPSNV